MPLPDGETLLAKTAARALALPGVAELVTVTNREYYFHTKDAYAGLRGKLPDRTSYLLEPFGRNTAPAVALAALWARTALRRRCRAARAARRSPDPRSRRVRRGGRARRAASRRAARWSRSASRPRIRRPASATSSAARRSQATAHRRSPRAASSRSRRSTTARAVPRRRQLRVELGHVLLHADGDPRRVRAPCAGGARRGAPDRADARRRRATRRCSRSTPALFAAVPDISLDYAVMEKAAAEGEVAVVRGTFDWSDVGSWQAMADLDAAGRGRQSRPGRARRDRDARHLRPRGRSRRRDRRRREPGHRRHARRRAGRAPRSPAAREGRRRRAEGARPRVLPAAQDGGAAVGRLHGAARKRPASRSSASR